MIQGKTNEFFAAAREYEEAAVDGYDEEAHLLGGLGGSNFRKG